MWWKAEGWRGLKTTSEITTQILHLVWLREHAQILQCIFIQIILAWIGGHSHKDGEALFSKLAQDEMSIN